jgi:hypothetical protein
VQHSRFDDPRDEVATDATDTKNHDADASEAGREQWNEASTLRRRTIRPGSSDGNDVIPRRQ